MDFLRTLKKRRPKKHVPVRVNVVPTTGDRARSRRIRIKRHAPTLNLAFCFAFLLALAVVTQAQAEKYYIYHGPNGELVISNKQPPPGSKIIKQQNLPEPSQAQEPGKPQSNLQTEGSPNSSKNTENRSV
jgi:hypothetical protein